jgi:hypothetical protein
MTSKRIRIWLTHGHSCILYYEEDTLLKILEHLKNAMRTEGRHIVTIGEAEFYSDALIGYEVWHSETVSEQLQRQQLEILKDVKTGEEWREEG